MVELTPAEAVEMLDSGDQDRMWTSLKDLGSSGTFDILGVTNMDLLRALQRGELKAIAPKGTQPKDYWDKGMVNVDELSKWLVARQLRGKDQ
jgi:hypothetical protein